MNFSYVIIELLTTYNPATKGLAQALSMPRHHANAPTLHWASPRLTQGHPTRPLSDPHESSYGVHTGCMN
eukprot:2069361-Prymnesium_polylepis.1